MKKTILMWIIGMLLISSMVLAENEYIQDHTLDFKKTCVTPDQSYCGSDVNCTLTINNPNSFNILLNVDMTRQATYYNYSINKNSLHDLGIYTGSMRCVSPTDAKTEEISFEIIRNINQSNVITIDRCPLAESNGFVAGYFLLIAVLFLIVILNEIIFTLPFISFVVGISFVFMSIPLYACSAVVGIPITTFGLLLWVWEISQLKNKSL